MPNPVCPANCVAVLPPVSFDRCNPEIRLSEIRRIFVAAKTAAPFATVGQATEWTTRLSNNGNASGDEIRALTVIGDKPAPSLVEKEISGGRKFSITKQHVINFTIDEANDVNHELVRLLECGGEFRVWYETHGGHLYGGNNGIIARIKLDMVLARGDENTVFNGTVEWKARYTEERTLSPIALSYAA